MRGIGNQSPSALRERVFRDVLAGVSLDPADLRQSLLERNRKAIKRARALKEGIMRARYVRFEERRALFLLYRRLCALATERCVHGAYCKVHREYEKEHDRVHGDISRLVLPAYEEPVEAVFSGRYAYADSDTRVYASSVRCLLASRRSHSIR